MTLILNSDKTFSLTLLYWDNKTQKHNGQESIVGNWDRKDKILTLKASDKNKITYELSNTQLKIKEFELNAITYQFKSNDKSFFGSGYNLLEKEKTDEFLMKSMTSQ